MNLVDLLQIAYVVWIWGSGIGHEHSIQSQTWKGGHMQKIWPGQARARSFGIKLEGNVACSLRREKLK